MDRKNQTRRTGRTGQTDQTSRTIKHRCANHPQRIAAAMLDQPLCWECYYGPEPFRHRFGQDAETFYQPGGPGYAGKP